MYRLTDDLCNTNLYGAAIDTPACLLITGSTICRTLRSMVTTDYIGGYGGRDVEIIRRLCDGSKLNVTFFFSPGMDEGLRI